MMDRRPLPLALAAAALLAAALVSAPGCAPPRPEETRLTPVATDTVDPAVWGRTYPVQYRGWLATKEKEPAGRSRYKRGNEGPVPVDKVAEYPFMSVLFEGFGFGIDYNEPRGHWWMFRDQQTIDPSRVKAGAVCFSCKTPFAPELQREKGAAYYSTPYADALRWIPEEFRELGVSCRDCHDNKTMALRVHRWTLEKALADIGLTDPREQQMRTLVCAQCHCTYNIPKDAEGRSAGLDVPWEETTWGAMTVEAMISRIQSEPARLEWTQRVTGFKLGFIRHPDVEFYTYGSVHFRAGVSCADCHMPFRIVDGTKASDHQVMSPLKNGLVACTRCHPEDAERLRQQVLAIQDRQVSMLDRAGFQTAAVAKLFELANSRAATQSPALASLYETARDDYEQAFYRVVYLGAENSVGFHNPSEGGRIAADALAFAGRAEGALRQLLSRAGVDVPPEVDLEMPAHLARRGPERRFDPGLVIHDPFGTNRRLWPRNYESLSGRTAEATPTP